LVFNSYSLTNIGQDKVHYRYFLLFRPIQWRLQTLYWNQDKPTLYDNAYSRCCCPCCVLDNISRKMQANVARSSTKAVIFIAFSFISLLVLPHNIFWDSILDSWGRVYNLRSLLSNLMPLALVTRKPWL
jgi:hypothetical protein